MSPKFWIGLAVILLADAPLTAQTNGKVWVAAGTNLHEFEPGGSQISVYGIGCLSVTATCAAKVARDGLGNVFVSQLGILAPGVSGSIRAFRSGSGQVAQGGGATEDLVCSPTGGLWVTERTYLIPPQTSPTHYLKRMATTLSGSLGSFPLPPGSPRLAAHPGDGIWVALSLTGSASVFRVNNAMNIGSIFTWPSSIGAIAADRNGRLWFADSTGTLSRLVESPGGILSVDWSTPIGTVESLHVDLCGVLHAHLNGGSTSSVRRYASDGTFLSAISYPVAFNTMALSTDGGYTFAYSSFATGLNLVTFDGLTTNISFVSGFTGWPTGDWTGARWCSLVPETDDSDGDGASNREEWRRGSDVLDPQSRPPSITVSPTGSGSPVTWSLLYADSDPAHIGLRYQLALSLSAQTGFQLTPGLCPIVPLDPDDLFQASLVAPSSVFIDFNGPITAQGQGQAFLVFPPTLPSGIPFQISGVTWSPITGVVPSTSAAVSATTP